MEEVRGSITRTQAVISLLALQTAYLHRVILVRGEQMILHQNLRIQDHGVQTTIQVRDLGVPMMIHLAHLGVQAVTRVHGAVTNNY